MVEAGGRPPRLAIAVVVQGGDACGVTGRGREVPSLGRVGQAQSPILGFEAQVAATCGGKPETSQPASTGRGDGAST